MGCLCGGGTTKTTQTTNSSSSTQPVIPEDWSTLYKRITGNLGDQGYNTLQTQGADVISRLLGGNAIGNSSNVANAGQVAAQNLFNQQGATLNAYANNDNPNLLSRLFSTPTATAASAAAPGDVQAKSGANFISNYTDPYTNAVVNTTLANYDKNAAGDYAGFKAANAGSFANKRYGLAEGKYLADSAANRAAIEAGLRSQGFGQAASLAQNDASRDLSAGQTNAGNTLDLNKFNSSLEAELAKFNAGLQDSRQKSDISSLDNFDNRNIDISKYLLGTGVGTQSNLGTTNLSNTLASLQAQSGLAGNAGSYGGLGTDQLLRLLGLGTATFGSNSTGTSTGTGTSQGSGNLFGTLAGLALAGGKNGFNWWH